MVPQNNLPDVDSLRCFVAAAERLNFRAAAGDVHLSPAAFGERIKRLEAELGAELFERTTRSVRLTPAGERLVPAAKQLLASAGALFSAVHDAAEPPYALVLGTRYELGLSWLVPALPALEREVPARRIHLYFGDSDALLARLVAGRADAAITSVRLASAGFDYVAIHEEHYAFVASPKLVAERPLTKAAHARAHALLDVHPDLPLFRYFLDRAEPEPAFTFERQEHLGTIGAVKARVLAGAGVAVLPAYFVAEELARRRLVRLFPKIELPTDWFRLLWRTGHPRSEALRQLGESLRRFPLR
ncbi:LysR family transcriptional regulator [Myxococcota bacterium]|nr:LysR family transcriptional regulator [Myxococcota bacterium]